MRPSLDETFESVAFDLPSLPENKWQKLEAEWNRAFSNRPLFHSHIKENKLLQHAIANIRDSYFMLILKRLDIYTQYRKAIIQSVMQSKGTANAEQAEDTASGIFRIKNKILVRDMEKLNRDSIERLKQPNYGLSDVAITALGGTPLPPPSPLDENQALDILGKTISSCIIAVKKTFDEVAAVPQNIEGVSHYDYRNHPLPNRGNRFRTGEPLDWLTEASANSNMRGGPDWRR